MQIKQFFFVVKENIRNQSEYKLLPLFHILILFPYFFFFSLMLKLNYLLKFHRRKKQLRIQ